MLKKISIMLLFISNVFALQVGEISMLRGEATVTRGLNKLSAKIQMPIEDKDIIKTKEKSKVQLTFNDDTVITLGSQTNFKVEEYLYENQNSKANFNVEKGSFKVITGKIGKLAPKNFILKTKTSLIGIRGTIFAGRVGIDNLGGDYIACIKGSIMVSSIETGAEYNVNYGEAIFVKDDGSMEKVEKLDQQKFTNVSHLEKTNKNTSQTSNTDTAEVSQNSEKIVSNDYSIEEKTTEDEKEVTGSGDKDSGDKDHDLSIDKLINQKVTAEYKGKLNGVSSGKFTTSSSTTNLKADIQADIDMKVDFGGNSPLQVNIANQKLTLNEANVDGTDITGSDLDSLKQQLSSTSQFTTEMEMKQDINPDTLKITGNYDKSANGFNTNAQLDGTFKDNKASGIKGTLKEHTSGSANGVSIDRNINASFDVNKN